MKKILLIYFLLIGSFSFAQRAKLDSVLKLLKTAKEDTTTAKRYNSVGFYYNQLASDSALYYLNKGLALSQKVGWKPGEARSQLYLNYYFGRKENFPKALSSCLNALKIYEKLRDTASVIDRLNDIGILYRVEEDYERYVKYSRQAYILAKLTNNKKFTMITSWNMGHGFAFLKVPDSALIYFQESYVYAMQDSSSNRNKGLAYTFYGIGRTQLLLNNYTLALTNFHTSMAHAMLSSRTFSPGELIPLIQSDLSTTFNLLGQPDSALIYAYQSLATATSSPFSSLRLPAYNQLADLYMGKDNNKAAQYFKLAADLRDSLFTSKRKAEMSALTFNEEERQNELVLQQQQESMERKSNLQYAAIAIGLIAFIILFFALSRSIIVNTRFISFFAILGLLAVFEFINLFIHPYLSNITNHSPVLMLIILIAIGALLIPLHHKLETWITKMMVEKNKKIRLEAAKKTIAKLEK